MTEHTDFAGLPYDKQNHTPGTGPSVNVHEELKRVQRKCYELRQQIQAMHAAFDQSETAKLRAERDAYRKALSTMAWRIDQGTTDLVRVRLSIRIALETWDMPRGQRRAVLRKMTREVANSLPEGIDYERFTPLVDPAPREAFADSLDLIDNEES